jgi:hypothetical protein
MMNNKYDSLGNDKCSVDLTSRSSAGLQYGLTYSITAGKLAAIVSVAAVRCDTCTALVALINDRRLGLRPACVGGLACISGLGGASFCLGGRGS